MASRSTLRGHHVKDGVKRLAASISLTSLVDAFTIMVIYLLVNSTNQSDLNINTDGLELPKASVTEVLKSAPVVKVIAGRYFVEDREVSESRLQDRLNMVPTVKGKEKALVIQADRNTDFNYINPILTAGAKSGFTKFRFAVVQGG